MFSGKNQDGRQTKHTFRYANLYQGTGQGIYLSKIINDLRMKVHESGRSSEKEIDDYVAKSKQIFLNKIILISKFCDLEKEQTKSLDKNMRRMS